MSEKPGASPLVIRKNAWSIVPMAAAIFAFVMVVSFRMRLLWSSPALGLLFMFGVILIPLLRTLFRMSESRIANVEVDERGVFADGKKLVAPEDLRGVAYLRPREKDPLLVYFPARRFWKSFGIEVTDERHGAELLARFGQDQSRAAVRFRLASGFENPRLRRIATIVLVLSQSFFWFGGMGGPLVHWLLAIYLSALAIAGLSFLIPTYVTIGADGILIARRGTRRFVRFADLLKIEEHVEYKDAMVLTLADFKQITLRTSIQDRANYKGVASDQTRALRKRLDVGLAAFRNRDAGSDVLLALGRANKSTADWIASLAKTATASGYRVAPVSNEQLWAVLEDPAAESDDRAAALIALRAALDDDAKARVRRTIEACAEPRLRVALDAAISDDESQLEAALDALGDEAPIVDRLRK